MTWLGQHDRSYFKISFASIILALTIVGAFQAHGEPVDSRTSIPSSALMENPQQVFVDFENSLDRILNEKLDLQKELEEKRTEKILLIKKLDQLSSELKISQDAQAAAFEERLKIKDSRIGALDSENKKLVEQYYEISTKNRDAIEIIHDLQQRLRDAQEKSDNIIVEIKANLNAARNSLAEKSLLLEQLKQEKSNIENELQTTQTQKEELRAGVLSLNQKIKLTRESYLGSINEAKASLEEKIKSLNTSLEESQSALKNKEDIIAKLNAQDTGAEDQLRKMEDEKNEIERLLSLSKEKLEQAASTIDQRVAQAQEPFNDKLNELQKELNAKEAEIKNFDQEKETLNKKVILSQAEKKKAEANLVDLQQTIKNKGAGADSKIAEIKAPLAARINDLQALLDQKEEIVTDKQDQIKELNEKQKDLSRKLAAAEKERDSFRETISQLTAKVQAIPEAALSDKSALKQEIEQLKHDLQESRREVKEKASLIEQLNSKQKELSSQLKKADQTKQNLDKTVQSLKSELRETQVKTDAKVDLIRKPSADEIVGLRKELEEKTIEIKDLKAQSVQTQKDFETAVSEYTKLKDQLSSDQEKVKQKEGDVQSQIVKAREPLERALDKIKADLQEKVKVIDEQAINITALKSEKDQVEKSFKEAKNQLKGLEKKNEELQKNLDTQRSTATNTVVQLKHPGQEKIDAALKELEIAKKELDAKQSEITELSAAKQKIEGQFNNLTAKKDKSGQEIEALKKEIVSLNSQLSDKVKTTQASLNDEVDMLNKKVKDNEDALRNKEEQIRNLKEQVGKNDDTIVQLTAERVKNSARLESLEKENAKLLADVAAIKKSYKEATADADRKINEAQITIASLNKTRFELQQSLDASVQKQDSLKKELDGAAAKSFQIEKNIPQEVSKVKSSLNTEILSITNELKETGKREKEKSLLADSLNKKAEKLSEGLNQMTAQKNELEGRLNEATANFNNLQKSIPTQIASAQADLESKLSKLTTVNNVYERKLKESDARIASLENIQKDLDGKITKLSTQKSASEKEALEIKKKLEGAQAVQLQKEDSLKSSFNEEIKQLQSKVQESNQRVASKDEVIAQLTAKQQSLNNELNTAISSKSNSEEALEKLHGEFDAFKSDFARQASGDMRSFTDKISALEGDIRLKTTDIEKLKVENKSLNDNLTRLTNERDSFSKKALETEAVFKKQQETIPGWLDNARQPLQKQISSLNDELTVRKKTMDDYETKIGDLLKEKDSSNRLLIEIEKERDSYKSKSLELQGTLKTQQLEDQEKYNAIEAQLKTSQETGSQLAKAKSDREASLKKLNDQYEALVSESKESKSAYQSLQNSVDVQLASTKKPLEEKIADLSSKLSLNEAANIQLTKNKTELENLLKTLNSQREKSDQDLKETLGQLKLVKDNADAEIAAVKKPLQTTVDDLFAQLNIFETSQVKLNKEKAALENSLKQLSAQQEKLGHDYYEAQEQLKIEKNSQASQLAAARKPLDEKIEILLKSMGDAQKEVKEKELQLAKLEEKTASLEKSLNETSASKVQVERDLSQTRSTLEETRKNINKEVETVRKPLDEKITSLQSSTEQKENQIVSFKNQNEQLKNELETALVQVKKSGQDIIALNNKIQTQQTSIDVQIRDAEKSLSAQIEEMAKSFSDQQALMVQKENAFRKLAIERADLEKKLQSVETERNDLNTAVKNLETKVKSIPQEVAAATSVLEKDNSNLKLEVAKSQGMLEVRIKGLESDLEKRTVELGKVNEEKRDLQSEIVRIMAERSTLAKEANELRSKFNKNVNEFCGVEVEALQKPWQDKISGLEKQLESQSKEIEGLKEENARINKELSEAADASEQQGVAQEDAPVAP